MSATLMMLEAPPVGWTEADCMAVCCVSEFMQRNVEAAGKAFHEYCRQRLGVDAGDDDKTDNGIDDLDEDARMRAAWEERRKKDVDEEHDEENLYEILGVGHLGFSASFDQIKKGYKKSALLHHPDKLSPEEREKVEKQQLDGKEEPMFLKVQRAWDILSDPTRRRGYDSQFAFDDSIPNGQPLDSDEDFFEEYGAAFEMNARFSVKKPVPNLGNNSTPLNKVQQFYRFWQRFESWRDFSKFDEFKNGDIESAQSRMEKRWMMRQNEIQQTKRKKKEYERLVLLVNRAMAIDPRILRAKEEERIARENAERERIEKREAEERAIREAEEARIREKEAKESAERERVAKERSERQAKRKAFKGKLSILEILCETSIELIKGGVEMRDKLGYGMLHVSDWFSDASELEYLIAPFTKNGELPENSQVTDPAIAKHGLESAFAAFEELKMKKDAAANRKEEERAATLKHEQMKIDKSKEENKREWTPDELSFLAKGIKKFPPGARNRWLMVANFVNTLPNIVSHRTQEECIAQSKQMANDAALRRELGSSKAAFDAHQKKLNKQSDSSAPTPSTGEAASDEWTAEQQEALEAALKEYPASMEKNERWKAIAKAVPGKTKKDCVARFKHLRQMLLEKKGTA